MFISFAMFTAIVCTHPLSRKNVKQGGVRIRYKIDTSTGSNIIDTSTDNSEKSLQRV